MYTKTNNSMGESHGRGGNVGGTQYKRVLYVSIPDPRGQPTYLYYFLPM